MTDAHVLVMQRAVVLWVGSGLLLGFNIFAAFQGRMDLVMGALAASGAFAVFGIAFGIWAARRITARP